MTTNPVKTKPKKKAGLIRMPTKTGDNNKNSRRKHMKQKTSTNRNSRIPSNQPPSVVLQEIIEIALTDPGEEAPPDTIDTQHHDRYKQRKIKVAKSSYLPYPALVAIQHRASANLK